MYFVKIYFGINLLFTYKSLQYQVNNFKTPLFKNPTSLMELQGKDKG